MSAVARFYPTSTMASSVSIPGTYALVLELQEPAELRIGSLGLIRFDRPFYIYVGSAFGPGGVRARIGHHLRPVRRAHWHIDYLKHCAKVFDVWQCTDRARWECNWAMSILDRRGTSLVPRFGASDCRCPSHLIGVSRHIDLADIRRRLQAVTPGEICRYPAIRAMPDAVATPEDIDAIASR